jgi:hypothetical protein
MRLCMLAAVLLVSGCAQGNEDAMRCVPPTEPSTREASRVTGSVAFEPPLRPLTRGDTLVIEGTALHLDGLAIRAVAIGAVRAELLEFNFERWRLQLSWEAIASVAEPDAEGRVSLPIHAFDACGARHLMAEVALVVDASPQQRIDALSLAVSYPGGLATLPSDGTRAAAVEVRAEGRGHGATVRLRASGGTFQGGLGEVELVLAGALGEDGLATGTVLYQAGAPGVALLTAEAAGQIATATIEVAGPPEIAPGWALMAPGAAMAVTVKASAGVARCSAQAAPGLHAELDEGRLGLAPRAIPEEALDAEGRLQVVVVVDGGAEAGATLELVCEDVHGQAGAATFEVGGAP